jgi:hypothetical protein
MSSKHRKRQYRNNFNIELIVSLIIIMATTLGTTIPLYLHANSQMNANREEMNANIKAMREETNANIAAIREDISAIHEEMKDFHGRLCAIEERNKK